MFLSSTHSPSLDREKKYPRGFSTLLGVLIISSIVLALSITIVGTGLRGELSSKEFGDSMGALYAADACAEEGLRKVQESGSFSGSGTLTLSNASCTYTVVIGVGEARTIQAEGVRGSLIKRVVVTTSARTPNIVVSSWKEVATF